MSEFKLSPLMLFVMLLLILITASFYSRWAIVEGFETTSNPFSERTSLIVSLIISFKPNISSEDGCCCCGCLDDS